LQQDHRESEPDKQNETGALHEVAFSSKPGHYHQLIGNLSSPDEMLSFTITWHGVLSLHSSQPTMLSACFLRVNHKARPLSGRSPYSWSGLLEEEEEKRRERITPTAEGEPGSRSDVDQAHANKRGNEAP